MYIYIYNDHKWVSLGEKKLLLYKTICSNNFVIFLDKILSDSMYLVVIFILSSLASMNPSNSYLSFTPHMYSVVMLMSNCLNEWP